MAPRDTADAIKNDPAATGRNMTKRDEQDHIAEFHFYLEKNNLAKLMRMEAPTTETPKKLFGIFPE